MPPFNKMAESHCIPADTVQAAMPFPKLIHCHDKLAYPKIAVICKEIYQNLANISSPFGNGQARFLGIMMPEALYVQCFVNHLQPPLIGGE